MVIIRGYRDLQGMRLVKEFRDKKNVFVSDFIELSVLVGIIRDQVRGEWRKLHDDVHN
jgi:hypothetical protein